MPAQRHFFWLITRDPDTGRPILIKGGNTEEEARQKGLEMLNSLDFDIQDLHTTSMAEASARLRGKRLEEGAGLRDSMHRQLHEKSVERLNQRRRRLGL